MPSTNASACWPRHANNTGANVALTFAHERGHHLGPDHWSPFDLVGTTNKLMDDGACASGACA